MERADAMNVVATSPVPDEVLDRLVELIHPAAGDVFELQPFQLGV